MVIDAFGEGKPHYRSRIEEAIAANGFVVISSFVLHELVYGAMISKRPQVEKALIDRFLLRARIEPWTADDAIAAAQIRLDLRVAGVPIGAIDSLIAGQAKNRGWNIVTSNVKDFIRIPGLEVVDWSDPAGPRRISRDESHSTTPRSFKDFT